MHLKSQSDIIQRLLTQSILYETNFIFSIYGRKPHRFASCVTGPSSTFVTTIHSFRSSFLRKTTFSQVVVICPSTTSTSVALHDNFLRPLKITNSSRPSPLSHPMKPKPNYSIDHMMHFLKTILDMYFLIKSHNYSLYESPSLNIHCIFSSQRPKI